MGSKAGRLAELASLGLPVPGGFVVTTAAFTQVLESNELRPLLAHVERQLGSGDGTRARRAGAEAATAVRAANLGSRLREQLGGAYSALVAAPLIAGEDDRHGPLLAVRSSAVGEDGRRHSHAGQYESLLNLRGLDAVLDGIKEVWASWYSERAIGYRLNFQQAPGGLSGGDKLASANGLWAPPMAVLVQRMVVPRTSGMLFTAHPVSGSREEMMLEAGPGLGEALAQGRLHPDYFVVKRSSEDGGPARIVERAIARKEASLQPLPPGSGRLKFQPVAAAEQTRPSLADGEVLELCAMALQAEALIGEPVDVEWAIDGLGRIRMLQARPVTGLAHGEHRAPRRRSLRERPVLWTQRFSGERWTEGATTLGWSIVQPVLHHFTYWEDASERWLMGTEPSRLVRGRPYFNITIFRHLAFRLPGGSPPQFLLEMFPPGEQEELRTAAPYLPNLPLVAAIIGQLLRERRWQRYRYNLWTNYEEWEAFRPVFEAKTEALSLDFTEAGAGLETLQTARELMVEYLGIHLLSLLFAHLSYEALDKALRSWVGLGGEAIRSALVSGPGDNETLRCNRALWALARRARDLPAVAAWLTEQSEFEPSELAAIQGGPGFHRALDGFLDEFGHRSSASWEIFASRWVDSPEVVLQMVAGFLRGGLPDDPSLGEHRRAAEREQAERLVKTRMSRSFSRRLLPWRLKMFGSLLVLCRRYMVLRENQRFTYDRLLLRIKRILERVGALLERDGLLDSGADIVFLEVDEVAALAGGELDRARASARIEARKHAFESDLRVPHPDFLSDDVAPLRGSGRAACDGEQQVYEGLGISSGSVRGRVKVLESLAEMGKLEPGDILVTRAADPGWTPLFLTAGALVLELGSMLSHGAVVAREYRLPAVVNVQGATRVLEDGMEVTVDGDFGRVTVHRAGKGPQGTERDVKDVQ